MTRKQTWVLIILLVAALVGAGIWLARDQIRRARAAEAQYQTTPARRGEVSATIGASGQVNALQSATLSWQTSGRVAKITVRVGQRVQAGDTLASLEPTTLPAVFAQAQSDLLEARRELQERTGSETPLSSARLVLIQAEKDLRTAQEARDALDQPRATPTNIEAARAAVNQARADLNEAEQAYSLAEGLAEDDPLRLQLSARVVATRRQLQQAEWNLAYVLSTPSPVEYERADAALELAKASLEDARREVERLQQSQNTEIEMLEARIEVALALLDRQHLKAPFDATITESHILPGDVVNPGTPAFRLDDLEDMDLVVRVPEVDINRVRVGQPVQLVFDAASNHTYQGTVQEVARAGESELGTVNFFVRVHADNLDELIRPGMTAAVTITVARAENALVVPNRAIRIINGRRYVYILRENQAEPVEITVGVVGDSDSEILGGGLSEGDEVILNPASQTED